MKRECAIAALATALLLCGSAARAQFIVKDQQYRCPSVDPQCAGSKKKLPAFEAFRQAGHRDYSANFVEVAENGELWDKRQLDEALTQIDRARDGGRQKPIVFVYIHGWQNNADERENAAGVSCDDLDGDVAKFRECGLKKIAQVYPPTRDGAPPNVVGIYLAWRGLSTSWEPFKHFFSYWPRRNKARFVGGEGMFMTLRAIVDKVGEHRDDYHLVMVGHSFGSRVLEYAAEAIDPNRNHMGFMAEFRQAPQSMYARQAITAGPVKNARPVDLFVYVNAATSHRLTYQTINDWVDFCKTNPGNGVCRSSAPMYLATSSRTDYATGILMPVANFIGPAFKADRLHLISAADTPWKHTHRDPKEQMTPCAPSTEIPGNFCFEVLAGGKTKYFDVQPTGRHESPFWILNTGRYFIRNHGDVWNDKIFGMVEEVVLLTMRRSD